MEKQMRNGIIKTHGGKFPWRIETRIRLGIGLVVGLFFNFETQQLIPIPINNRNNRLAFLRDLGQTEPCRARILN